MSKLVYQIAGDFSLKDKPRSGRSVKLIIYDIKAFIEPVRHVTEREIGKKLDRLKLTVHNHIRLRLVKNLDIWVPHQSKRIH